MKTIDIKKLLEEYEALSPEERKKHPLRETAEYYIDERDNPLTEEEKEAAEHLLRKSNSGVDTGHDR